MKKITITSVLSYVFLLVALVFFFVGGLSEWAATHGTVYGLVRVEGFAVDYDLMAMFNGSLLDINITASGLAYAILPLSVIMMLVAVYRHGPSNRSALIQFLQIIVFAVAGMFYAFSFVHVHSFWFRDVATEANDMLGLISYYGFVVLMALYLVAQFVNFVLYEFCTKRKEKAPKVVAAADAGAESRVVVAEEAPAEEAAPVAEEAAPEAHEEAPAEEAAPVEEAPVEEAPEEVKEEDVAKPQLTPEQEETNVVPVFANSNAKPKAPKTSFEERLARLDPTMTEKYHAIRDEIMAYGIKSRVSSNGDTFRLHTVKYMKMIVAGKKLKLFMRLNPKDYADTTIPYDDASNKGQYKEIPFVFKVQSDLSVKRAKQLIADMMAKEGIAKKEVDENGKLVKRGRGRPRKKVD